MIASPRTLVALAVLATALGADRAQAGQARGSDLAPPTPLEQALIDHACRDGTPTAPPSDEPYQSCLALQLRMLRSNFGRDLRRLTGADRRTVDARCTPLQASRGHDAYVSCLDHELETLLRRRGRGAVRAAVSPTPPVASQPQPTIDPPVAPTEPVVEALAEPSIPSHAGRMWMAALAVGCGLAALAWRRLGRNRHTAGRCRQCGAQRPGPGDLCADCRREAAGSRRRTTSDATSDAPPVAGGAPLDRAAAVSPSAPHPIVATPDDLARAERMRVDEEARVRAGTERAAEARRAEEEARREEARRSEARRRREEEVTQLSTAADAPPDVFNPYLVLGVTRGATATEIEAAYAAARQKYAPDQVEHLGAELRDHFKSKSLAADRAYQLLAAAQVPAFR